MKKLLKFTLLLLGLAVAIGAGVIVYVVTALPNIKLEETVTVQSTPERIERGRYLAHHVAVCMDCHSTRDWSKFSGPPKDGTLGVGGERFDQTMNFPGAFVAPNITPHGIGDWSDAELYRAITSGVTKEGAPLFPIMPYPAYGQMATEDIYSIIAYLRTLPAIVSSPAASKADPPVNVIMHLMPNPAQPRPLPAVTDKVAYGEYLTNAAGCTECHTKMAKGKIVGEPFAGGFEFTLPGGTLRSANITPHITGIGSWTRPQFVARFKAYAPGSFTPPAVDRAQGHMQTVMPWVMYAGMTEEDLGAIYDYLKTLKPVENLVERWSVNQASAE
jgi:mono/diheme cytochrome c family protein